MTEKRKRGNPNWPKKGSGIPAGGVGWGGEARGTSAPPFTAERQPTSEALTAGHAARRTARELAMEHVAKAVSTWAAVLDNPEASLRDKIVAAEKLVERAEGAPTNYTELTVNDSLAARMGAARERAKR